MKPNGLRNVKLDKKAPIANRKWEIRDPPQQKPAILNPPTPATLSSRAANDDVEPVEEKENPLNTRQAVGQANQLKQLSTISQST
tara:strand:- start:2089 stop:2343 length:255 start_codon:yes stop_codon:yes gene_type:complete